MQTEATLVRLPRLVPYSVNRRRFMKAVGQGGG